MAMIKYGILRSFIVFALAFGFSPIGRAKITDLPTCSSALASLSVRVRVSSEHKRIIADFKNNDEFAGWFLAQGYTRATLERMDKDHSVARNAIMEGRGNRSANFRRASKLPGPYEQILDAYNKRDRNLKALVPKKTINFESLKLEDARFRLELKKSYSEEDFPSTPEDIAVASLRKGDTVVFRDRTFTLGRFLGAGDATHIFEIENEPELVIRIPFSTLAARRHHTSYERIQFTIDREPKTKTNRVKIEHIGSDFDYLLVTKINGDENGEDFLRTIPFSTESIDRKFVSLIFSQKLFIKGFGYVIQNSLMRQKYFKLLKALEVYPQDPRQFIWDKAEAEWILVDWE